MVRREPRGLRPPEQPKMDGAERVTRKSLQELAEQSTMGEPTHEYVGHGGDQVVLKVRETTEGKEHSALEKKTVIKLTQRFITKGIIAEALRTASPEQADQLQPIIRTRFNKTLASFVNQETGEITMDELGAELDRAQEYEKTLRTYFEKGNVLRSVSTLRKVPVAKGAVREILTSCGAEAIDPKRNLEVPTLIRVQHRIPDQVESMPDSEGSFGLRYMERYGDLNPDEVDQINDMAFSSTEIDLDTVKPLFQPGTINLLEQAKEDEQLKAVMQDFVRRAIDMANEGGEMIDIAGSGNVKFYQKDDGAWDYLIIDADAHQNWGAFKERMTKMLEETPDEAMHARRIDDVALTEEEKAGLDKTQQEKLRQKKHHKARVDQGERLFERIHPESAINGLNYARSMNLIASTLNLPDRVQIVDFRQAERSLMSVLAEVHHYNTSQYKGERHQFPRNSVEREMNFTLLLDEDSTVLGFKQKDLVVEAGINTNDKTMDFLLIDGDIDEDAPTDKIEIPPTAGRTVEEDTSETLFDF